MRFKTLILKSLKFYLRTSPVGNVSRPSSFNTVEVEFFLSIVCLKLAKRSIKCVTIPRIRPVLDFLNAKRKVTKKGIKSRLDEFQNIFHSSGLNNDAAETIITAPSVADGM